LHNQIYISSYDLLAPLWLTKSTSIKLDDVPSTVIAPHVFGDDKLYVHVRREASCAPCSRQRGFCGKNFNYFVAGNQPMAEIWPTGPHTIRSVDLKQQQGCRRGLEPETVVDDTMAPITTSFATVEEVDFPTLGRWESILTRGRGGACCIPMLDQNSNRTLLVGIQHSKTPSQRNRQLPGSLTSNHYLSSLYAFEVIPPYRIVAQSGWFCLGFPTDEEKQTNPLVRATSWRKLILGSEFDCPRIHFVSGMTLKADDPTTVIVAYGINDCVSRMVQIKLSEFERLLFGMSKT